MRHLLDEMPISKPYMWIAIAGCLGVLARATLVFTFGSKDGAFPLTTFSINMLGSFLIGLGAALSQRQLAFLAEFRDVVLLGFLGGFTTFSAFSLELLNLLRGGNPILAIVYGFGSPVAGLICAYLGWQLTRMI